MKADDLAPTNAIKVSAAVELKVLSFLFLHYILFLFFCIYILSKLIALLI